jgi:hypothetical protein
MIKLMVMKQEAKVTSQSLGKAEIHLPREYFAAAVSFACKVAQLESISLVAAIENYTGLYREVTGWEGLEGGIDPLWSELMVEAGGTDGVEAITQRLYNAYLAQPHSRYVPRANNLHAAVFGALGYVYLSEQRQARMHFFAHRSGESALSSRQVQARRADFRRLLLDLRGRHSEVETIKSSTWLHNLPNYRDLFPPAFQARLKNIGGSTYIGIWGQFAKADGSGNVERLEAFRAALLQARHLDEAIQAFPFKVFEAVGPVGEFYASYDIGV